MLWQDKDHICTFKLATNSLKTIKLWFYHAYHIFKTLTLLNIPGCHSRNCLWCVKIHYRGYFIHETVLQWSVMIFPRRYTLNYRRMCLEEWQRWLKQKKVTQTARIIEIVLLECKVKKVSQWVIRLKCPYLRTVMSGSHAIGTNNIPRKHSILTHPYSLVIFPHPDPQSSNYMKTRKHWDTFLSHCRYVFNSNFVMFLTVRSH